MDTFAQYRMSYYLTAPIVAGFVAGIALLAIFAYAFSGSNLKDSTTDQGIARSNTPAKTDTELTPEQKAKFDTGFYDKVISMINAGETRGYDVVFFVGEENKDLLMEKLEKEHMATDIVKGKILSFVIAKVPVREIPELVQYAFIIKIGDGELRAELA